MDTMQKGCRLRNISVTCFSYHWNGRKRSPKVGPMCMLTTTKDQVIVKVGFDHEKIGFEQYLGD